jgi:hypothetical protein
MQMYEKKNLMHTARIAFLSMLTIVFLMASCKESSPTTLEVTVVDANGTVISEAKVWLEAEPTDTTHNAIAVEDSTVSNNVGKAYFDLTKFYKPGQIGVMQIKVKGFYFGLTGEALAEITELERNQVLLQLQ